MLSKIDAIQQSKRTTVPCWGNPDVEIRKLAKEEIDVLKAEIWIARNELKGLLLPEDPNDQKNIILEIRARQGGEEAALFAR